jgi:hypothetical protein
MIILSVSMNIVQDDIQLDQNNRSVYEILN